MCEAGSVCCHGGATPHSAKGDQNLEPSQPDTLRPDYAIKQGDFSAHVPNRAVKSPKTMLGHVRTTLFDRSWQRARYLNHKKYTAPNSNKRQKS
jgi:hypothetical protein